MDKLENLYKTLVGDRVELPAYAEWTISLQTDEGLSSLRDLLKTEGWEDIPEDIDEFASLIGVEKKNGEEQPSESPSPEEDTESNSFQVEDIQGELESINARIQELDEKIKDSKLTSDSLSRSTGMYGIMAADTSENRKLKKERDELRNMRNVLQGDKDTVEKETWRREMEERYPISAWDNTKAILKNTLLGLGTGFLGFAQGAKMPQYYLEKMLDKGVKSLEDKDIIGSETAEFIKKFLSPSTSTTVTIDREAKQYTTPTVAEELAAFTEQSLRLKQEMTPTIRMIDAIRYGDPVLIAMQAVDAVTNYIPSIAVGATTGGLGFIPMFAGEAFADAAALKADLTDKELKEFIEDYDADVIVPSIIGGLAGALERKLLMGLKTFVFNKQMTSGFVNKFKDVIMEGGRQGLINWIEAGLMDMNLEYARTGDLIASTKRMGEYLVSEDGLNALLESFVAGTLMAGGGRGLRPQKYFTGTEQMALKTDMADVSFIGKDGEYFMRSDYLTHEQAQEMMDELQDRYPNLEFTLQDNTNKDHVNAPANWTVKAEAKKAEGIESEKVEKIESEKVEPEVKTEAEIKPEWKIEKEGEVQEFESREAFLEALRTTEDLEGVKHTVKNDAVAEAEALRITEEKLKPKEDAVQKPEAEKVDVQEQAEVSKEVGEEVRIEAPKEKIEPVEVLSKEQVSSLESFKEKLKAIPADVTPSKKIELIQKAIDDIKKEEWFTKLSDSDKLMTETTLRDLAEKQAGLAPSTREVLATQEPAAKFTISIGDRVRMEQRAARDAEIYTRKQYNDFVDNLIKEVNDAVKANLISKRKMGKLIRAINRAAKVQKRDAQVRALENINEIISEINDPQTKIGFKKLVDRFNKMMQSERIAKIGEGKRVLEGVKTPEYAKLLKDINDLVDMEKRAKEVDFEAESNNLMEELVNETDQTKRDDLVDRISQYDMNAHEVAHQVQNLRNAIDDFVQTKPGEHRKRTELFNRAIEAMDALSALEEQSNQARLERRAEIERQTEERKAEREARKNATLTEEQLAKREFVNEFREQIAENRDKAYDDLIAKADEKTQKKLLAEKEKENTPSEDMTAVQKIMDVRATEARKALAPIIKKPSVFQNILNLFSAAHYDNLRGLLRKTVKNKTFKKAVMELDRMADGAAEKYAELVTDTHTVIDQWHAILNLPPGYQGMATKLRAAWGTKIGNTFYLKRKELGLKGEQLYDDFNKLSYNDVVYIDALMRSEDNIRILEKEYDSETVTNLRDHVANIVNSNEQLKAFSTYLKDVIIPHLYKVTNEVYKRRFGTDMPNLDNYMRRYAEQARVQLKSGDFKSIIPKHILQRGDPGKLRLIDVDIMRTINDMYEASNKWNAFYETQRKWEGIYGDKSVRNAIVENIPNGKEVLNAMDAIYKSYPTGVDGKYFGFWAVTNAVMSRILLNPSLLLKQTLSAPNALGDFNTQMAHRDNWGKTLFAEPIYFAHLVGMKDHQNWIPFLKHFIESPTLKERRRHGHDPHLRAFQKASEVQAFFDWMESHGAATMTMKRRAVVFNEMLRKLQGIFVKSGDIIPFLAIKPNYDLRYNKFIREGMEAEAASKKAFERSVSEAFRTQQPAGRAHLLSAFQTSFLGRNIPYITAPVQMGQNLVQGFRDATDPLSTPSERVAGIKNVGYYGYVQPYIWIWGSKLATNLMRYILTGRRDEDELISVSRKELEETYKQWEVLDILSTGILQGRPIHKVVRDNIAYKLEGKPWEASLLPAIQMIDDVSVGMGVMTDLFKNKSYDEFTDYERFQFGRFAGDAAGILTGHGVPTAVRYGQQILREKRIVSYWDDYKKNPDLQNFFFQLERDMKEQDPDLSLERRDKNKIATEHRAYFKFVEEGDRQTKDDIRHLVAMPSLDRKARYLYDRRQDFEDFPSFRSKFYFEYGSPLGVYRDADGTHDVRPLVTQELWERYIENYRE